MIIISHYCRNFGQAKFKIAKFICSDTVKFYKRDLQKKLEVDLLKTKRRELVRLQKSSPLDKAQEIMAEINKLDIDKYFSRDTSKMILKQPLQLTSSLNKYDIIVNVVGGGQTGQAGAIRLAIARGLQMMDKDLRASLKKEGMLTRDSREVERKKYGQPGARKKFQFSKR